MSLLDNNYDFDAMESMIDFKVEWCDPINYVKENLPTADSKTVANIVKKFIN